MVDFAAPDGEMLLRKRNYYRRVDPPSAFDAQTFAPYLIESGIPEDGEIYPGWVRRDWTLLFSDGQEEASLASELFWTLEASDAACQITGTGSLVFSYGAYPSRRRSVASSRRWRRFAVGVSISPARRIA